MGTIRETVRVKANDDVYQRIIQKQQDAKRESEKKTWDLLKIRNAHNLKMNLLLAFGVWGGGESVKSKLVQTQEEKNPKNE